VVIVETQIRLYNICTIFYRPSENSAAGALVGTDPLAELFHNGWAECTIISDKAQPNPSVPATILCILTFSSTVLACHVLKLKSIGGGRRSYFDVWLPPQPEGKQCLAHTDKPHNGVWTSFVSLGFHQEHVLQCRQKIRKLSEVVAMRCSLQAR